ncbi:NAD-dependent epimerase/dehydratase family protein [Streptomyces sp. NPDC021100]|uniref:NAD-dependent epimerase/dehydratase family protein n=1 Tax=Streptomyces sp. NPDC021100 TaxID=3365114 RepID=UPI003793CB83
MHVLITGAAGFIGRNLLRRLTAAGHTVTGTDNFSVPPFGPVPEPIDHRDVRDLTPGDLADADAVVHMAALKSVPGSFDDAAQALHNTAVDDHMLRTFAATAGRRRLLMASSCEVYGNQPVPCAEHHTAAPRSPYAVAKAAAEMHAVVHRGLKPALDITCLRLHNTYGADEGADAVIPRFIDTALRGEPLPLEGDGSQARDFSHIDDLVTMLERVLTDPERPPVVLNLGSGHATTIATVARHVLTAAGLDPADPDATVPAAARPNEIRSFTADMSRYTARYGPVPTRRLADGITTVYQARAALLSATR